MAYTPELSYENSCNLRRLAWFLNKPMTSTLETLIELRSVRMAEINPGEVGGLDDPPWRCNKVKKDQERVASIHSL